MRPPTPAEETALRVLLKAEARRLLTDEDLERLGREAISRIEARIHSKNGAPGWTPGTPVQSAAHLEGHTAMTSMQVQAHQLRPDDIITRHPDHPDQATHYRVRSVRHVSHAEMMIDYTYTSEIHPGVLSGVLVLSVDHPCRIDPAHASGGVR